MMATLETQQFRVMITTQGTSLPKVGDFIRAGSRVYKVAEIEDACSSYVFPNYAYGKVTNVRWGMVPLDKDSENGYKLHFSTIEFLCNKG